MRAGQAGYGYQGAAHKGSPQGATGMAFSLWVGLPASARPRHAKRSPASYWSVLLLVYEARSLKRSQGRPEAVRTTDTFMALVT